MKIFPGDYRYKGETLDPQRSLGSPAAYQSAYTRRKVSLQISGVCSYAFL